MVKFSEALTVMRSPRLAKYPTFREGLLGYWEATLGVTSNTAFDFSGYDRRGALIDGTTWENSFRGPVWHFSGTQRIALPETRFTDGDPWTVAMWINKDDESNDGATLGEFNTTINFFHFGVLLSGRYISFSNDTDVDRPWWGSQVLPLTGLHHWVFVADGSGAIDLYKDGKFMGVGGDSSFASSWVCNSFGNTVGNSTRNLDGTASAFSIWNRILTLAEVQTLAKDSWAITRLAKQKAVIKSPVKSPIYYYSHLLST